MRGPERLRRNELSPDQIQRAGILCAQFRGLDERDKEHLRIPLDRLNRSKDRVNTVDSAIELGIALESLFLTDDEKGEIGFRLRTRTARFLETEEAARLNTALLVRDLYDLRSTAVHTGRLKNMVKRSGTKARVVVPDLLQEGYDIVTRAIVKIIEGGAALNWKEFDLR